MAQLRRKEAERLIKKILTEYARKIRSAKKREYAEDIQQQLFNPKIDAFYKLAKSEDMDFYIFNRLNDEGIRQLLVGCRRLAKCYELDSYGKIKDFTYEPETSKCRIASDSDGKYSAGGSYTFTVEGKAELGNKWYEPHSIAWHFYRENPGTGKYEETASKMDEARALADFDTWDRSFLVSEKGRYKVTATIFNQAITTGIRPDIVEVCELYFEAEDDTDAAVANLKDYEKVFRAIRLANYGDAFESLGKDIAAITLTLVAFVGIGVILKKIPTGKLKPFLIKLAEKLAAPELMAFFGTYGDAFDIIAFIEAVCNFYEQATNARNEIQLREAGKTFERVVETFGLVAVMGFMDVVGHKMKKAEVENEIELINKKSPEDILRNAGYKDNNLINNCKWKVKELRDLNIDDDTLIGLIKQGHDNHIGLEKTLNKLYTEEVLIKGVHRPARDFTISNKQRIYELSKYYNSSEIKKYLNADTSADIKMVLTELEPMQKMKLKQAVSHGTKSSFYNKFIEELKNQEISEDTFNAIRDLDYTKMTREEFEKVKKEINVITNLTQSYDLNKVPPKMMRKYIPVEEINKYLSGEYKGVGGFIARVEDVEHLETFEDIFYTMRLDYDKNRFVFTKEIAYIDFSSVDYSNSFVPIGKNYGGDVNLPQPFGGLGLLKTENGQFVREYKTFDKKYLEFAEATMYKVDKKGRHKTIAVYDNDIKCWVRK